jgi:hypothetical protein
MATAFGAPLLGTALVVILESTDFGDKAPHWAFFPIIAAESKWTTKAVPSNGAPKTPSFYANASNFSGRNGMESCLLVVLTSNTYQKR